ncbi:Cof-like hydrolase [Spiroplasma syrphidicola EA-1]|uniref:Cof-like hydrolase n=1 Tax=Spiroplasma syrphidicola EA-1 TaxID=1276229 RepID=R4UCV4_9MOLU|nr:HAD family hydrolase [Spiroplasma syrphidicola]AGM25709.1 Cof-like hydrolase [Spiroplasma syrphidicola EA-1]
MELKINEDSIKVIVTDIDGTLLTDQRTVLPATAEILKNLQANDYFVSIASGRMPMGFNEYSELIEIKKYGGYVIGANGAIIYDLQKNKTVKRIVIPKKAIKAVTDILLANNCNFNLLYHRSKVIYFSDKDYFNSKLTPGAFLDGAKRAVLFKPRHYRTGYKIVMYAPSEKVFDKVLVLLNEIPAIKVEKLSATSCDIVSCYASKSEGIVNLLTVLNKKYHLKLTKNNVLYFGDNYNDLSVFKTFPYAIAMENSSLEVIKLAYAVTSSNNVGGISDYLTKMIK